MIDLIKISDKQKEEAVERMKKLGLMPQVIEEFKEGKLNFSESAGFLYWIDENTEHDLLNRVKAFEKEYNAVVYHVIHNLTEFGELYSYLYVSAYEEEWEYDRADIDFGYAVAYVENIDDGNCSEFGSIVIKPTNGGLMRIG